MEKSGLREQVEELLSVRYQADDPIKERIGNLIDQAYDSADVDEWEDISERFKAAFVGFKVGEDSPGGVRLRHKGDDQGVQGGRGAGSSDGGTSAVVQGESSDDSDAKVQGARDRPPFDSLIKGGFFAKYLEWTSEHESPSEYHFGAAITAVAAGLGRRPRIEWEARPLYPNIYTLLVGPSGARKGAAIDRALRLVVPAMGTHQLPNEGTHQGFAAALKRRLEDTDDRADGLIVAPEFGVLMSRDRNKADLVKWLTDWYDSPDDWNRALRGEEFYELRNLYVCVLGGSTMPWLRDMPSDAITGGFMPRFILFDAQGKRFWNARPSFNKHLERELSHRLTTVADSLPEIIRWSDGAANRLDDWYEGDIQRQYEECNDIQFRKWLERKQSAAMKLAVVWQLADGGPKDEIAEEWFKKAVAVVDWGDHTVARVYNALGVTQEGQAAADVMEMIEMMNGGATLRQLCKVLKKKYTKSRVQGALNTLHAAGDLKKNHSPQRGIWWEMT